MITDLNNFVNEFLGSYLALPANGLGGSRVTSSLVAHFALQNTASNPAEKNRAKPEKQKGKKEGGLGEGIFALLRIKIERFRFSLIKRNAPHSCSGFSLKKVRISFSVRSQIVCSAFVASAQSASARALRALRPDFKRICHAPRGSKTNSRSRKIRFAVAKQQNSANGGIANLFSRPYGRVSKR